MRAVLNCTGYRPEVLPLVRYRPTPLLNIADKPILFYIIEFLVEQGIGRFEIILSHLPAIIEERLGDGKRWGINITFHLSRSPAFPFTTILPATESWGNDNIVLGLGDVLPLFEEGSFKEKKSSDPELFMYPTKTWSGWAILPVKALANLPDKTLYEEVPHSLKIRYKIGKVSFFYRHSLLLNLKILISNTLNIRNRFTIF